MKISSLKIYEGKNNFLLSKDKEKVLMQAEQQPDQRD